MNVDEIEEKKDDQKEEETKKDEDENVPDVPDTPPPAIPNSEPPAMEPESDPESETVETQEDVIMVMKEEENIVKEEPPIPIYDSVEPVPSKVENNNNMDYDDSDLYEVPKSNAPIEVKEVYPPGTLYKVRNSFLFLDNLIRSNLNYIFNTNCHSTNNLNSLWNI